MLANNNGYFLIFYGLSGSPPTLAHKAILRQLLKDLPLENDTLIIDENNYTLTKYHGDIVSGTLASLGVLFDESDVERRVKIALAQQNKIHYSEVHCMLNVIKTIVSGKKATASDEDRLAMSQRMVDALVQETGDSRIKLCNLEIELAKLTGTNSYTVNTLKVCHDGAEALSVDLSNKDLGNNEILNGKLRINQHTRIKFVMGKDSFNDLYRWNGAKRILDYLSDGFVVFDRSASDKSCSVEKAAMKFADLIKKKNIPVEHFSLNSNLARISSTRARQLLKHPRTKEEDRELRAILPQEVIEYIDEKMLYR